MKVTFVDLLRQEKEKMEKANEMRIEVVEAERLRKLDEANAWGTIKFKEIGATSDKLRSAAVSRHMNQFPNTAGEKKAKLTNLENEIKFIRETLGLMKEFGLESIDLEEDKNKESGNSDS